MELLVVLFLIIFLIVLFGGGFVSSNVTSAPDVAKKVIKHGHRCYSEGLNEAEETVLKSLSQGLSHNDYFIFNNLIIPSPNSKSTQIDHIIISRFGIFVIETKACSGWIFAHKNREKWAVTYPSGEKHHFYSPLWQNYGHIQALKTAMPFVEDNFFGIIAFVGSAEFKTPRIHNVVFASELVEMIQSYAVPKISEQRLLMAIGKLSYMCQATDISPEQHVENIKQVIADKQKTKV